jgi:hypothetical protein
MNKRLIRSIDKFCDVAEFLNSEIEKSGEIQKNNLAIWNDYLHSFTNKDWEDISTVVALLSETQYVKGEHIDLFDGVLNALDRMGEYYDNVMDLQKRGYINNKPIAWKGIMYVREIYCDICDIYLPNTDESKLTHKEKLFQVE